MARAVASAVSCVQAGGCRCRRCRTCPIAARAQVAAFGGTAWYSYLDNGSWSPGVAGLSGATWCSVSWRGGHGAPVRPPREGGPSPARRAWRWRATRRRPTCSGRWTGSPASSTWPCWPSTPPPRTPPLSRSQRGRVVQRLRRRASGGGAEGGLLVRLLGLRGHPGGDGRGAPAPGAHRLRGLQDRRGGPPRRWGTFELPTSRCAT